MADAPNLETARILELLDGLFPQIPNGHRATRAPPHEIATCYMAHCNLCENHICTPTLRIQSDVWCSTCMRMRMNWGTRMAHWPHECTDADCRICKALYDQCRSCTTGACEVCTPIERKHLSILGQCQFGPSCSICTYLRQLYFVCEDGIFELGFEGPFGPRPPVRPRRD